MPIFRVLSAIVWTQGENPSNSAGSGSCAVRMKHYYPPFAPLTPWCNGNTGDFDSLVQGSSPCGVATWSRGFNQGSRGWQQPQDGRGSASVEERCPGRFEQRRVVLRTQAGIAVGGPHGQGVWPPEEPVSSVAGRSCLMVSFPELDGVCCGRICGDGENGRAGHLR